MEHKCILCDQKTGSREHIFPAAFGGRRVNKNIYCAVHNKALGRHIKEMLKVLSFLNARRGVRSDHHKAPKPHIITRDDGVRYQFLKDQVELAPPPPLNDTPELVGQRVTLEFGSMEQAEAWIADQRKDGYGFSNLKPGPIRTELFTQSLELELKISKEFLVAIAYVGLTLFAHYFPFEARQQGLASIKDCVLNDNLNQELVWWVDPKKYIVPSHNEFPGMHTVVVAVSKERKKASALVSLFGKILLAVDLGTVDTERTKRIFTYVNPLAERASRDIDMTKVEELDAELLLGTPDEGAEYLHNVVSGTTENPIGEALAEILYSELDLLTQQLLPKIEAATLLHGWQRRDAILEIVEAQTQRIYNITHKVIDDFAENSEGLPPSFRKVLRNLIIEEAGMPLGISPLTAACLTVVKAAFAQEILCQIDTKTITKESLKMLFGGGAGAATALKAVIGAVLGQTL